MTTQQVKLITTICYGLAFWLFILYCFLGIICDISPRAVRDITMLTIAIAAFAWFVTLSIIVRKWAKIGDYSYVMPQPALFATVNCFSSVKYNKELRLLRTAMYNHPMFAEHVSGHTKLILMEILADCQLLTQVCAHTVLHYIVRKMDKAVISEVIADMSGAYYLAEKAWIAYRECSDDTAFRRSDVMKSFVTNTHRLLFKYTPGLHGTVSSYYMVPEKE